MDFFFFAKLDSKIRESLVRISCLKSITIITLDFGLKTLLFVPMRLLWFILLVKGFAELPSQGDDKFPFGRITFQVMGFSRAEPWALAMEPQSTARLQSRRTQLAQAKEWQGPWMWGSCVTDLGWLVTERGLSPSTVAVLPLSVSPLSL